MTTAEKLVDALDIPACLLLTLEQRCAGWKRQTYRRRPPRNVNNPTSSASNPQQGASVSVKSRETFVPT